MENRKKPFYIAMAAVCLVIGIAVISGSIACSMINLLVTLSTVDGTVEIKKAGRDKWRKGRDGALLKAGSGVRTGGDGSCVLEWGNGNVAKVAPESSIIVDELVVDPTDNTEKTNIALAKGELQLRTSSGDSERQKVSITTPSATVSSKGTRFIVNVDEKSTTSIMCYKGKVGVSGRSGNEVIVAAGLKTLVNKGEKPLPPEPLDAEDLARMTEMAMMSRPQLIIIAPAGKAVTSRDTITVRGHADDDSDVTVNGKRVSTDPTGNFSADVALDYGKNNIVITAKNEYGEITGKRTVTRSDEAGAGDGRIHPAPGPHDQAPGPPPPGPPEAPPYPAGDGAALASSHPAAPAGITSPTQPRGTAPPSPHAQQGPPEGGAQQMQPGKGGGIVSQSGRPGGYAGGLLEIFEPPGSMFNADGPGCQPDLLTGALQCRIAGRTAPGAILTIQGRRHNINPDGSFAVLYTVLRDQTKIEIIAQKGGIKETVVLTRLIKPDQIFEMQITAVPSILPAGGAGSAQVMINAQNFFHEPVNGGIVDLQATAGGTLSAASLTVNNGMGSVVFTADDTPPPGNVCTITAVSGNVTAQTQISVVPPEQAPPPPDRK